MWSRYQKAGHVREFRLEQSLNPHQFARLDHKDSGGIACSSPPPACGHVRTLLLQVQCNWPEPVAEWSVLTISRAIRFVPVPGLSFVRAANQRKDTVRRLNVVGGRLPSAALKPLILRCVRKLMYTFVDLLPSLACIWVRMMWIPDAVPGTMRILECRFLCGLAKTDDIYISAAVFRFAGRLYSQVRLPRTWAIATSRRNRICGWSSSRKYFLVIS
jgi:hypothetical protein